MVNFASIQAAQTRIRPYIFHSPLIPSSSMSLFVGADIYLKAETLQKGGSFKVRGAINKVLSHHHEIKDIGVTAASAGNHAQGVAIAAHIAGVPAVIVMPEWSSLSKQEATRAYGAKLIIHGQTIEESARKAKEISMQGSLFIHPFDDEEVIAGQGTIALELFEDLSDIDTIIVPVGGGGLISGIAVAAKNINPSCKIIGVQSSLCPCALDANIHGEPVCINSYRTIADGIRVTKTGDITFPLIQRYVDDIVTVTDDEIACAMLWLLEHKKIISEGAGAVCIAAVLSRKCFIAAGSRVALIISGGNVDSHQLSRILRRGLTLQGRIFRFSVIIEDKPGFLARLLTLIGNCGGNILHIHHTPGYSDIPVHEIRVDIELETRGLEHIKLIQNMIQEEGYHIAL